ncbi:MAG: hypothetical protein A2X57_08395 [Nitrospirae bacterium GWD2_57_8]|nr:MAG: hypothetical protein A2X57_08395 [Nitrospirae bacterium GWD2_57_8]
MAKKSAKTDLNILELGGAVLLLIGALAVKDGSLAFVLVGLVLFAVQMFEMPSLAPKKAALFSIVLSVSLTVAAVTQLFQARGFKAPQVFLLILLIGAILITVESVRKFLDR